jgi:hypothetical protein
MTAVNWITGQIPIFNTNLPKNLGYRRPPGEWDVLAEEHPLTFFDDPFALLPTTTAAGALGWDPGCRPGMLLVNRRASGSRAVPEPVFNLGTGW